jgi:molybdenum cofactor biosynthesis enzyme MoaA
VPATTEVQSVRNGLRHQNRTSRPTLAPPTTVVPSVPTTVHVDRTLRVKVIDGCGMTCTFCHNEGTPVATDNSRRVTPTFTASGTSGRVSIYIGSNGAMFVPATVLPDAEFASALGRLSLALDLNELHLTGGEPTLRPGLADLVRIGTDAGLRVCVTSNGERGNAVLADCADAGLDRINFSIFGTTAEELAEVQHARFANVKRAERKIVALRESIETAERVGVRASANIVVPHEGHAPRVVRLLNEYAPSLSVRLLNSLDEGQRSIEAIERILAGLRAVPVAHHLTAGVSGSRTAFALPTGRIVWFKQIRRVRLPETCAGCRFNNDTDCQEGFYGVRLYKEKGGPFQVGVCIQRMDLCLPLDEFIASDLCREVVALRDLEYRQLVGR